LPQDRYQQHALFANVATSKRVYVDLLNGHNAYINSGPQNNGSYTLEDSITGAPNMIASSGGDVLIADNATVRITGGTGAGHSTRAPAPTPSRTWRWR
jgi:hypothetical protein